MLRSVVESYFGEIEEPIELPFGSTAPRGKVHSARESPNAGLLPGNFLKALDAEVRHRCPPRNQPLHSHSRSRLSQFWFGPVSSIHYEVWIHDRTSQLEIGFHCESTPDYNRLLYSLLDASLLEIQSALGHSFWLEDWDNGWIRLYETQRLWPLDTARVGEVADRIIEVFAAVQPLYEDFAARNPPPSTGPHGRSRRA